MLHAEKPVCFIYTPTTEFTKYINEFNMSLFEFLMVLVSVIVGLGIAEILTGTARTIRHRKSINGYWLLGVVVVLLFVALLQQWWEIWEFHAVSAWTFHGLLMMLAGPVGLFLMAHLVFPEPMQGANLQEHYYGAMRPMWWLGMVTITASTLFRPLIFQGDLIAIEEVTSFIGFFTLLALAVSKNRVLHTVLVPSLLLLIVLDVILAASVISEH